ncbi:hypothetical protein GMA11_06960 [Granulicatella sp. zg-ZJ]|uniref:Bax inhibitor-1/YccA family protein n=1 Tax=Granulicatella sp. zg-ZJ TaxID=2678504 RepID=UPI0013D100EE|nr:Bax inhibitor-1/YccA family protein [Granulicatella sp. zg-ZJ]NEW63134.1 hypothetical protein [Granulicatella sp. zg-ZJ]
MEHQIIYSVEQEKGLNRFVARTFLWMMIGLAISTLSAYMLLKTKVLFYHIVSNSFFYYGIFMIEIMLAYSLRINLEKIENKISYIVKFIVYSILTGVTFAVVGALYEPMSIVYALVSTIPLFAMLAIYGYTTNRDLTKIGTIARPIMIGLIISILMNGLLFKSNFIELMISIVVLLTFSGLTAYDMQKIKAVYLYFENQPHVHNSLIVSCALELYLDFINMFISVLNIFGKLKD